MCASRRLSRRRSLIADPKERRQETSPVPRIGKGPAGEAGPLNRGTHDVWIRQAGPSRSGRGTRSNCHDRRRRRERQLLVTDVAAYTARPGRPWLLLEAERTTRGDWQGLARTDCATRVEELYFSRINDNRISGLLGGLTDRSLGGDPPVE